MQKPIYKWQTMMRSLKRMEAILCVLLQFRKPATVRDITRSISRSAWGGVIHEETVDALLKRMPEVEYVKWGKYILRRTTDKGTCTFQTLVKG